MALSSLKLLEESSSEKNISCNYREMSNVLFVPSTVPRPEQLGTFRSEYEYDYEYEFSVLSTRIRFRGRHFSKCACSERKTRTRSRTRTPI